MWVAGCKSAASRSADLTAWGAVQLRRRLLAIPSRGDQPLVYSAGGSAKSRQAASCIAVSMTLVRVGLGDDPGIRPVSVTAWAGRKVMERTGRLEDVAVLRNQQDLCHKHGDLTGVAYSLGDQALVHGDRGDLDEAMRLHREQEALSGQLGDWRGISRSLGNQATIHLEQGRYHEALTELDEKERICRQDHDVAGLAVALANRGAALAALGEGGRALAAIEEANDLVVDHSLGHLAQQIEPMLAALRQGR